MEDINLMAAAPVARAPRSTVTPVSTPLRPSYGQQGSVDVWFRSDRGPAVTTTAKTNLKTDIDGLAVSAIGDTWAMFPVASDHVRTGPPPKRSSV